MLACIAVGLLSLHVALKPIDGWAGSAGTAAEQPAVVGAGLVTAMASSASYAVTFMHAPELFDTETRATAHALLLGVSQVGAFAVSYVVDTNLGTFKVGVIVAAADFICALAVLRLPDSSQAHIH